MTGFLKTLIVITFEQFIGLFGTLFVLGYALYILEKMTTTYIQNVVGNRGVLWTAWLGAPVHEIGHAVFCILFGHKIVDIAFFKPDSRTGVLGYVNHTFNPRNIYHRIGNPFIALGPLLFGTTIMYALLHLMVPNSEAIAETVRIQASILGSQEGLFVQLGATIKAGWLILTQLFSVENLSMFRFYLFLYLSACIAAHIAPSPTDLKGAWKWLLAVVCILIVSNLIILLFGFDPAQVQLGSNRFAIILMSLFIYAVMISLTVFILIYITLSTYSKIRYNKWLKPF